MWVIAVFGSSILVIRYSHIGALVSVKALLIGLTCLLSLGSPFRSTVTHADGIGYSFNGLTIAQAEVFGNVFPGLSPISGRLVYDSYSSITHPSSDCDCAGYRQQIYNGLSASIGTTIIRADDYLIEVLNDFEQGSATFDLLSIRYDSTVVPAPAKPLMVGGNPFSDGQFLLQFTGAPSVFSDSQLPEEINLSDFLFVQLALIDPNSVETVIGSVTSLVELPVVSGDYNYDLAVDGHDFLTWQRNFRSTTELAADGNHNMVVDNGDLLIWEQNFGMPTSLLPLSVVPEPSACLLAISLLTSCGLINNRRH